VVSHASTIRVPRGVAAERYRLFSARNLHELPQLKSLPREQRCEIEVLARVFPFRVSEYVVDQLIDWDAAPDDPVFRLVFPQREMLAPADFDAIASAVRADAPSAQIERLVWRIRAKLNPHPAGQMDLNAAYLDGEQLHGVQHKYEQTVLYFPARGQVCHSYCTFCFRWAQFVGDPNLRFASKRPDLLARYLRRNRQVTDVLITGGDPMVMRAQHLEQCVARLLAPELEHVRTIRIGTKSLSFWPHRYVSDPDAPDVLRLLERCVRAGKQVAIMAHLNHWRELDTPVVREAIRRIRSTGAVIRSQGPLLRHINDDAAVWSRLWRDQVALGVFPYYMFVERDTGAKAYFEVPLARGWRIYRDAMKGVSGLARTARGPSMSTSPGKVEVQGVTEIRGERVFVLRFIQGRNPDWVQRPFFARYDESATWLDELEPAFGEKTFFFEDEFRRMTK
jgi:KamA family protein